MGSVELNIDSHQGRRSEFPPTRWSLVLRAAQQGSAEADRALAELCEAYWYPLYAYVRRQGQTREEAQDLVQGFFERLLAADGLGRPTQERGRFRSFLLAGLRNFQINAWNRERAQKRGGGRATVSIDDSAETLYQSELLEADTPETMFDRRWAWTVIDRALSRLENEYRAGGKHALFERVRDCLPGAPQSRPAPAEACDALGMSEAALRMAASRLRKRFGKALRAEVASTVASPEAIDEELRHLMDVVGSP
jgi:RNA polymerase sigma factor (sigma-70 family)